MDLTQPWLCAAVGLVCGILSGFGIGGGSLLMVWMTAVAALDQKMAQAINLLYFLPTSAGALIFHIRNKTICWKATIPAAAAGCITAAITAWLSSDLDVTILRRLFGCFLLLVGIRELLYRPKKG